MLVLPHRELEEAWPSRSLITLTGTAAAKLAEGGVGVAKVDDGKIERFFRAVRDQFPVEVEARGPTTLDDLIREQACGRRPARAAARSSRGRRRSRNPAALDTIEAAVPASDAERQAVAEELGAPECAPQD